MDRTVAVFGSSRTSNPSVEWSVAEDVGRRLAVAGFAVITGGYGGTMEAVSKGASEQGGHVVGVVAPRLFPERTGANPFVDELIEANDLLDRIGKLIDRADGVIALPGSIGTAAELMIAWNHNYLRRHNRQPTLPTVAVGPEWKALIENMIETARAEPGDIRIEDQPEEAVAWILRSI
jgi:uncharacterized protein (TIGR00730 family)